MDVIICYSINILGINLVGENKMNKYELIGESMNESENALQNLIDVRMLHLGEDRETATKAAIAYLSVLGRLTA
tara:strand:- start:64 stop:285 length:222 start_codon:yes stop_codon:yes gene_type:complete